MYMEPCEIAQSNTIPYGIKHAPKTICQESRDKSSSLYFLLTDRNVCLYFSNWELYSWYRSHPLSSDLMISGFHNIAILHNTRIRSASRIATVQTMPYGSPSVMPFWISTRTGIDRGGPSTSTWSASRKARAMVSSCLSLQILLVLINHRIIAMIQRTNEMIGRQHHLPQPRLHR